MLQQHFAGNALGARRFLEVIAELAFLGEVHALGLLLLAKLQAVAHDFRLAVLAMLARSEVALLDGTFIAEAFGAFEEQLHALAAAETADGIGITGQVASPLDDRFTGLASPFFPDENQRSRLASCSVLQPLKPLEAQQLSYTLRRFGGRQPLCGIGVASLMLRTSMPAAAKARIADSRPEPGPLTRTSTLRTP